MSYETEFKGICDLHIHAGPSISKRAVDAWEVFKNAEEAGYRAVIIKDHYFPTMMEAEVVQKHAGEDSETRIFGEICLNNAQGGINLKAVDAACGMNVKIVCMPTVSAKHHQRMYEGKTFVGGGKESVQEKPIYYLDENGDLLPEVEAVLDYLAKKPEVVLATGHGSPEEIDVLVKTAVKKGIRRILVNHPFCLIDASKEQMKEWASLGAFLEINACDVDEVSSFGDGDPELVQWMIDNIPSDRLIVSSDYGQNGNIEPVEGLLHFTQYLQTRFGATPEQVRRMCVTNPGWLMSLNELD
ncbi:MAG: DUF6282 family protein [Clostridiales bacterium]|nr:DUF6282 family protein [Clostridiales bacterium]